MRNCIQTNKAQSTLSAAPVFVKTCVVTEDNFTLILFFSLIKRFCVSKLVPKKIFRVSFLQFSGQKAILLQHI